MKLVVIMAGLLLATNAMGQFAEHRLLLIFKNEANLPLAQEQLNILHKDSAGIKERDLTIKIAEKGSALFKKYKADHKLFTVILIGKDGFEKYRTNQLLQTKELFSIIDAMPMRRREMKKTGN